MSEVVIVRKRDAKTDPPETDGPVLTDQGLARYGGPRWLPRDSGHGVAWWRLDLGGEQLWPPPLWWYDLRPTEGEGLTTEDLRAVLHMLALDWDDWCKLPAETQNYYNTVSPRLRAALDALTKEADSE